jgi:hypothetical protein
MRHYLYEFSSAGHLGRALLATKTLQSFVPAQKTRAKAIVERRGSGHRGTVIDLAANRTLVISAGAWRSASDTGKKSGDARSRRVADNGVAGHARGIPVIDADDPPASETPRAGARGDIGTPLPTADTRL